MNTKKILDAATATGAGSSVALKDPKNTFQAVGTTTAGAGSGTVKIEGSNDGENWIEIGSIALTIVDENTPHSDSDVIDEAWGAVRANVTAIGGTGTSIDVFWGSAV